MGNSCAQQATTDQHEEALRATFGADGKKRIVVTGANAGIGFALSEVLAEECHVFLCARSASKGEAAVEAIRAKNAAATVELVLLDAMSQESIDAAALAVSKRLEEDGCKLYALVNNAGCGLSHGLPDADVLATNVYGVKRVSEAFAPLIADGGRIVNCGSGAGAIYIGFRPEAEQKLLTKEDLTWAELEEYLTKTQGDASLMGEPFASMPGFPYYSFTKGMMMCYTGVLAREQPHLTVSTVHPGFIATDICKGLGATAPPLEGTVPIRWALFDDVPGCGWYFEEDCKRSALHLPMRNGSLPEYDGKLAFGASEGGSPARRGA